MIKGVIFDLDGTLIDSMQIWYDVDRKFLKENGVDDPPPEISERVKKMTIEQAAELFITEFRLKCTREYVIRRIEELVRTEYEENIMLKPHVTELMDTLDSLGIPCGGATATYRSLAEAVLRRCGIRDRLSFLLTDAEYPRGKRFPDIYFGAAELLGTKPGETLVIEDSLHCIETAAAAGFLTAAVYDKASEPDTEELKRISDRYFTSLDGVRKLIAEGRDI